MIVAKLRPSKNNMRPAFRDMTKDTSSQPTYATIEAAIGHTPLVRLQRIGRDIADARGNIVLGKLEGNNPAGSVKDRPALSMIQRAQERGDIKPGDTLIEATSGNTGIALAMAAAIRAIVSNSTGLRVSGLPLMKPRCAAWAHVVTHGN